MTLPKLTKKQETILKLLYSHRFLNRIQIQKLMNHKDKKTINLWLRDLTAKQYVRRIYSDHFLEKTKPAIYYLGINGIRFLKTVENNDGSQFYSVEQLSKRYREHERSRGFIDRSLLIADCRLDMRAKKSQTLAYYSCTSADYLNPRHVLNFLSDHETLRPDYFIKTEQTKPTAEPITTNYLLEIFDSTLPRYRLRKRLKGYVDYLINYEWEGDEPEPIILLVVPTLADLIYGKRRIKQLLENEGYDDDDDETADIHIWLTTVEKLKQHGITANIWEERRELHGV